MACYSGRCHRRRGHEEDGERGLHQVRGLQKGCDNSWHGIAVKDGNESHVVLTPQGQVMREGA